MVILDLKTKSDSKRPDRTIYCLTLLERVQTAWITRNKSHALLRSSRLLALHESRLAYVFATKVLQRSTMFMVCSSGGVRAPAERNVSWYFQFTDGADN